MVIAKPTHHPLRSLNPTHVGFVLVCFSVLQILGHGCLRFTVSAGSHMVLRSLLYQRGLNCHGIPLHHIQHLPRNVYLYLSLPPPEKSKFLAACSAQRKSLLSR